MRVSAGVYGRRRGTSFVARALVVAGAAACSSSSPSSQAAPPVDAGGDEPAACLPASACIQAPAAGQQCVTTMNATVVDSSGSPVAALPVYVCGTNLCTEPSKTASDGTVEVAACLPFAAPALKVFSDPQWGAFAALLAGAGPSYSLGKVTVTALPATGATLASGTGIVASGGVTLSLQGTMVTFDAEHATPDSQLFRAATVPPDSLPSSLQGPVTAVWALAPLNTTLVPPPELQLPNVPDWAPGVAVDFFLDGTDTTVPTPPAPWGSWGVIGTGAVSADGTSLVLTAAQGGLPEIAMVGVALHP